LAASEKKRLAKWFVYYLGNTSFGSFIITICLTDKPIPFRERKTKHFMGMAADDQHYL